MASPEKKEPEESKIEDIFSQVATFAQENKLDFIAYILLVTGIIFYVFNTLYGGIIVGGIAGFYFFEQIMSAIKGASSYVDKEGLFKSFLIVSLLFCLLISAKWLFVGAALSSAMMALVVWNKQ